MVRYENRRAVLVFMSMQTQWDRAGMTGERCGLKYSRISYVTARLGFSEYEDEIFDKLKIMERAALEVFADQAKHRARRHGRQYA